MPDLSTKYMGLRLTNPIIVSSSSLTNSVEGVKRSADAGAGAVVLKSLFEEQIQADLDSEEQHIDTFVHPEAEEYFHQMGLQHGPQQVLSLIEDAKKAVSIPVIASVNCVSTKWWSRFARQVQDAGADGIEINISITPAIFGEHADSIEKRVVKIVDRVRQAVTIPIAVKIGPGFTSIPTTCVDLRKAGASAIVLFNRFYQMDIDLDKMEIAPGLQYSAPEELYNSLRWISILHKEVGCDLAASTGVHDANAVVKQLLAGAAAVQVCSTVFKNGFSQISTLIEGLESWMRAKRYNQIGEFRGRMSRKESAHPEQYDRLQYIKAFTNIS